MQHKDGSAEGAQAERAALARARVILANKRNLESRRRPVLPTAIILAMGAFALAHVFEPAGTTAPAPHAGRADEACGTDDAACLGRRIIADIQAPCSRAIEAKLQYPPTWNDSAWERRFASPAWYRPPNQLIFHGRRATFRNGFGVEMTAAYFCVVTRGGAVVEADIPDLP